MGGVDVFGADDLWIANMRNKNNESQKHNASLIAAAPDLLAALEALLPLADRLHEMTYGPGNKSSDWKQQFDARAAIEKAKGGAK